jgi:cytochrome c peroxidase
MTTLVGLVLAVVLSETAQRGLRLFEDKAMCVRCHAGFNFTGEGYRNIGIGMKALSGEK